MKDILFWFDPRSSWVVVYMLQQFEYSPKKLLSWWLEGSEVLGAKKRGKLVQTPRVKLTLAVIYSIWAMVLSVGLVGAYATNMVLVFFVVYIFANTVSFLVLLLFTILLQKFIIDPKEKNVLLAAQNKLSTLSTTKIAVLGSYGKTTMKEMLLAVLSESKAAFATPGNKNVLISHARWINKIDTSAEVLIFEYGEGEPGDIAKLASFSKPDIAVITGLAPAHLDMYKDVDEILKDFKDIENFVKSKNLYVNGADEGLLSGFKGANIYSKHSLGDIKASNVEMSFNGITMTIVHGKSKTNYHSGLVGEHQVAPLLAVIHIAEKLGMKTEDIVRGIAKTRPFEHRMQPRFLNGAWIIDDTYNGNIVGMQAGLDLLQVLPAKQRIYVTPGLVDQGKEEVSLHQKLGSMIANAGVDKVILMQNSVTDYIKSGLTANNFKGNVEIVSNPLEYYTNLEHFVAAGDVVMMQNDWPDSYK